MAQHAPRVEAHDAGVGGSEAVGPGAGGGGLVASNADLDLGLGVHVSHELDEGGSNNLRGGLDLCAGSVAQPAAVEGLSVCMSMCLGGGGGPGSSLCLGLGATKRLAGGCACSGSIGDGAGGGEGGHIPDDLHVLHPQHDLATACASYLSKVRATEATNDA